MVTRAEFDALARKVAFLKKDNARLAKRLKRLENPEGCRSPAQGGAWPEPIISMDEKFLQRLKEFAK